MPIVPTGGSSVAVPEGGAINYYERHLGDYAKDTGHLSMLEHGAYTLLMDRYYATEAGIQAYQVYRVARARSKEEREATDLVLKEFFSLVDGVWIKNRIEQEIKKYLESVPAAEQRRENDKQRQRKARDRRSRLFQQLESAGIAMPWNATMTDLQAALSRIQSPPKSRTSHAPVTRDNTATSPQSPVPIHQSPEEEPLARSERFEEVRASETGEGGTIAGQACRAMIDAGLMLANPSHPHLLAALDEGVTPTELADIVREFPGKGMAYIVAAARGRKTAAISHQPQASVTPIRPRLNLKTAEELEAMERARGDYAAH